ncbi:MAG: hypothetical protein Q9201_007048, partial [Fulgogasparrea decipioides]
MAMQESEEAGNETDRKRNTLLGSLIAQDVSRKVGRLLMSFSISRGFTNTFSPADKGFHDGNCDRRQVGFNIRTALKDTVLPTGGGPAGNDRIGVLKGTHI